MRAIKSVELQTSNDRSASSPVAGRLTVPPEIVLTKFTKDRGPLTKLLYLDANGNLTADTSACRMSKGSATRVRVAGVAGLGELIGALTLSQAIALGTLREDFPDEVSVVVVDKQRNDTTPPGVIARTGEHITYQGPAFALLDYDTKEMPASVKARIQQHDGFWPALLTVLPALTDVARVSRSSTSSGLSRTDTGVAIPGSDGIHVYLVIEDGEDAARFLKTLHERCWLAGFGWVSVTRAGTLQERSIIDRLVGGPERLVFESGPELKPPLAQDKERRRPIVVDGGMLDTAAACRPLSIVERTRFDDLKARDARRVEPERVKARAAFIERQASKIVDRTGMPEEAARRVVIRQCEGVLLPDVELPFDAPELAGCIVRNVLADPDRFVGATLADPLEGIDYGPCKAKILRRPGGMLWIHSFAHGRTVYELKSDADTVRKAMEQAAKDDVITVFASMAAAADLNEVEQENLRQLAKQRSGVGLQRINRALKAAREHADKDARTALQALHAGQRDDPRPQLKAPLADAPWRPEMEVLNSVLGKVTADQPPTRDIDGDMVRVREIRIPSIHAFTIADANAEGEGETRLQLPPPKQLVLCKMNDMQVAELIEEHIDHYVEDKDGNRRSVHYPTPLVQHYVNRDDGALPTTVAIATAPIVMADGELLAPEGLDRLRGIQFIIPDQLRAILPDREDCTDEAVAKAMQLLCGEWLCDVATDWDGKCTIIAAALTLIERSLLSERPCFFITAGQRGNGKTTLITMLIAAVTGRRPAASAWSPNEEERRKSLMSQFLSGIPYILWDNIPRGAQISCPHIERSCTAAYYADRRLGVSEIVNASASTIHLFTGNNIGAKGDLASRSLRVHLNVDRTDPEDRPFRHPDPLGWTENHRAEILAALYTILLGNPQLAAALDAEGRTRFKMWWRLAGSAVEHAAGLIGREADFRKLFVKQDRNDEEAADLADVLVILAKKWWGVAFGAADVAGLINDNDYSRSDDRQTLRDFLMPGVASHLSFSARTVTRMLKRHLDEPVRVTFTAAAPPVGGDLPGAAPSQKAEPAEAAVSWDTLFNFGPLPEAGDCRVLVLRRNQDAHIEVFNYRIEVLDE